MISVDGVGGRTATVLDSTLGHPWHSSEGLAVAVFPESPWERIPGHPFTSIWAGEFEMQRSQATRLLLLLGLGGCSRDWAGAPGAGRVLPGPGRYSPGWAGAPGAGQVLPRLGRCSLDWAGAPVAGQVLPGLGRYSRGWAGAPWAGQMLPRLGRCSQSCQSEQWQVTSFCTPMGARP